MELQQKLQDVTQRLAETCRRELELNVRLRKLEQNLQQKTPDKSAPRAR